MSILLVSSFPIPKNAGVKIGPHARKHVAALVVTAIYSVATTLTAALWQHTAAATTASLVNYMSAGMVETGIGPAATAFVWLVFGLSLVTGAMSLRATYIIISSQRLYIDSSRGSSTSDFGISAWRARTEHFSEPDLELSTLRSTSVDTRSGPAA